VDYYITWLKRNNLPLNGPLWVWNVPIP